MNYILLLSANGKSRFCDNLGLSLNEYATVSYVSNTCNILGKPKDIYNVKGDGNCLLGLFRSQFVEKKKTIDI